jgi:Fe-S cluster biogenesis protein NfuA
MSPDLEADQCCDRPPEAAAMSEKEKLDSILQAIAEARPAIQADGGDIEFLGLRGERVEVRLTGKCLTCALAGQTLGAIRRKLVRTLGQPVMVVPIME